MKENEIRPKPIFDEFLRLLAEDTRIYFPGEGRVELPCPACGQGAEPAFEKDGFGFAQCPGCLTLYANPRPERAALERFYRESSSARYWATTFYKETEAARREMIWKPKARLIKEKLSRFPRIEELVDIGGGCGAFAEEMRAITDFDVVVVEPSPHLSQVCRQKGLAVVEKFLEELGPGDLSKSPKCFVSFELFEHLFDPADFLHRLNSLMKSGDLFIYTTLNGLGVDIQVLWERSKAVSPPQHLNFLNPSSMKLLLARAGFEAVEITTPGKLDLDIIKNNLPFVRDRFWKNYIRSSNDGERELLQNFLAENGLSSHMMTVARKAKEKYGWQEA